VKICAYVQSKFAKKAYKNENFNVRLFAGLSVAIDIIKRAGYEVEYAGSATVHEYDVVLVSITSDYDFYDFVAERTAWQKGNYKVVAGGTGVLNVRPFLPYIDYFILGRGEGINDELIKGLDKYGEFEHPSVINSKTFSVDKKYMINQVSEIYPHPIRLENGQEYREDIIGCNHKCLFCGYTWHRICAQDKAFEYSGLWNGGRDRERAMLDMANGIEVDLNKLRTTAIDGLSERLRFMVNKKITRDILIDFLIKLAKCEKPHQVKFYNVIGYPTEEKEDRMEFLEDIKRADSSFKHQDKQTAILLQSTPFRAMPATPMACEKMSYVNYRGLIGNELGKGLKGGVFYQGNAMWAVESMATEGLSTVIQSAIVWRGTEDDSDNFERITRSKKFKTASSPVKQATLEKYFYVKKLFGEFTKETLPTRYLKTYAKVEKMWK